MYLALYRKYRPQNFNEVIGQEAIITTLKNQIKQDRVGHAYLFCGSRGTGKTSTAKIFARAINCQNNVDGSPCEQCASCKAGADNNMDILEIDAASNNGVDEIRDLREKVKYPPVNGKYKVYIIDEVHMLSVNAFNALLKTLEEPPKHVVFILATTEVQKLPQTILSRCMRFDFNLVSNDKLLELLKKICDENKINYDEQALSLIVRAGEGSVRDMLSIADRCIAFCDQDITVDGVAKVLGVAEKDELFDIAQNIINNNLGATLRGVSDCLARGKSPLNLSKDLIAYFRDLLYCLTLKEDAKNYISSGLDLFEKMMTQATENNFNIIAKAVDYLSQIESELRLSIEPKIVLEATLVKLLTEQSLAQRVDRLEQGGVTVQQENAKSAIIDEKSVQKSENLAPNAKNVEVNNKPKADAEFVLGELLQELRKQNALSLVAGISQVKEINNAGGVVELVVDDEISVEMINSNKNKNLLDKYFADRNLNYKIVTKTTKSKSATNINDLSNFFGNKLQIS